MIKESISLKIISKLRRISGITIATYLIFLIFLLTNNIPLVKSAYTDKTKVMEFYLHYLDVPVAVAGLQTKYVINTTRWFRFATQQEAYANSFYKPFGLPKIVVDFYVYPNFAGPVTFNGTWQVFIWVNSSAYQPVVFTLIFKEITVEGEVLWDSGSISPTVTSSIGSYLDVPVYNYNLSTPLSHTFRAETTLLVEVEVNAGASADTRIWYDSPLYPSKLVLPAKDYARPISIKTYSADNSETTLFHYNWSETQRKVVVHVNVTNPFGGYDIYKVNMTIVNPLGDPVVDNIDMIRISNGQWRINYEHIFEANWSYPMDAVLGNYTVIVSVIDNNGYYHNNETGSFYPFIEEETYVFTIGVIVYYTPTFIVTDDLNNPLPNAQVYVTWLNGTQDKIPRYTTEEGTISLSHIPVGNYSFTVIWKDTVVQQTTIYVDSDGPYTIKTQVYRLTVQVFGNNGIPIHGAYVVVYTQSGVGYGLETTDAAGKAIFRLPSATYRIDAYYTSSYWFTVVRASATDQVSITTSTPKNIVLTEFPPAIWSTIGFWLLVTSIITVTVAVIFYMVYKRVLILRPT